MEKIEEQLISFETAKLAKELGFNYLCRNHYISEEDIRMSYLELNHNKSNSIISRPTQSLLQKWLREVHKLHIEVELTDNSGGFWFTWSIVNSNKRESCSETFDQATTTYDYVQHGTYEEALESGLLNGLRWVKKNESK